MVLTGLPSRRRMYNFTVEGTTPAGEKVVMFRTFRVGMHIVIIVAVKPYVYIITRKTVYICKAIEVGVLLIVFRYYH